MTSKHWLRKRFVHTCSIRRDNGTAQSSTGQVGTAWADVGTAIICRYYEQAEAVPSEGLGRVTVKTRHLLVDMSQDISVNDQVYNVLDTDGSTIQSDKLRVNRLTTPRNIKGVKYYRLALLELVETN